MHDEFAQVGLCAQHGKRSCTLGFVQQKMVHGHVFASEELRGWDACINDEVLHRMLSTAQLQRLLMSSLNEDNIEAELKSVSKNEPLSGGLGNVREQWVSTTSHQITIALHRGPHTRTG